jgi:hypothetical protein
MTVLFESGTTAGRVHRDEVDLCRYQRLNVGTRQFASPNRIPRVAVQCATTALSAHFNHFITIGPKDPFGGVVHPREQAGLNTAAKDGHPSPITHPPTWGVVR